MTVWPSGFDPTRLGRHASLNKLIIRPAPGARPAHVGQSGGDLLGRDAVVRLVRQRCGVDVRPETVADWLIGAIAADLSGGVAAEVVNEVGDRLASLIATLRSPATAEAATGARRTYLDAWGRVDVVMLGGGLMKGLVGERVAARAHAVLTSDGVHSPVVRVARHAQWLGLLGAARSASADDGQVVVLDGGQTSIKRGIAMFAGKKLVSLRVVPPVSVTSTASSELPDLVGLAVLGLRDGRTKTATEVIFSVASYVHDGRPVQDEVSMYAQLDAAWLESRLGVRLRLVHDGSAAWRGTDEDAPSAVIMLGTWLGVGIGPQQVPLRPYAPDFAIQSGGAEGAGPYSMS